MSNTYRAEWSGKYPNFCLGEWKLYRNEIEIELPYPIKREPMDTYGTYSRWYSEENWGIDWESYEDGLKPVDWIEKNQEWLSKIADPEDFEKIYDALSACDWRHFQCGGCT